MANEVSKIYSNIAESLNVARAKAFHTVNYCKALIRYAVCSEFIEKY